LVAPKKKQFAPNESLRHASPILSRRFQEMLNGTSGLEFVEAWDAGDQGCGELALDLRVRLEKLRPGEVFRLTSRDLGAPEDLPAWCRLTGHALLAAEPPHYWIRRKD
jgi:tRNA 2-thiouridine synthesizing protein A